MWTGHKSAKATPVPPIARNAVRALRSGPEAPASNTVANRFAVSKINLHFGFGMSASVYPLNGRFCRADFIARAEDREDRLVVLKRGRFPSAPDFAGIDCKNLSLFCR